MKIKPVKDRMLAERIYEEEVTKSGIIADIGKSYVNPHTVKMKVIEDRTINNFEKGTIVFCKFIGLQDMTGDEKTYLVHPDAMEAVLEE